MKKERKRKKDFFFIASLIVPYDMTCIFNNCSLSFKIGNNYVLLSTVIWYVFS